LINFEEELSNFSPIDKIDDIQDSINSNELYDIMDLLNYICTNLNR